MSGTSDQAKGRAKEAYGVVTDNDKLKSEGKHDQVAGEAKEHLKKAEKKIDKGIDEARESIEDALTRAKDAVRRD